MIYLYIAAAIAFIALGGYAKIQNSGKLEAQAEVSACNTKIEAQNLAVQQLKAEGDRRVAAAGKGIAKAAKATAKARSEAERLRVLASQPGTAGSCPAGEGVAEVRAGLK